MLKMSMIEFFIRLIPEALLFIFASYTYSGTKINYKRYACSCILFGIVIFCVRFLPINYGVHTIVNIIALTVIVSLVNRIDIIKSVKASIMSAITLFICEGFNILLLVSIFGGDLEPIMNNTKLKTLYSLPSLICFFIIIVAFYKNLDKRGKLEHVECRKNV